MPILLLELLLGCMVSIFLTRLAHKFGLTDKPDNRLKIHASEIPHVGGLAVLITAAIAYTILHVGRVDHGFKQLIELASLILLFEIGMIDDIRHLPVGWRLIIQIQIAIALAIAGNVFRPFAWNWLNYALTIIGIVVCINAINLLDIMDGLAGGISLFTIAGLSYTFVERNVQSLYPIIGIVIIIALIPFLISNFSRPPNKSFLGDSGSTMLGLLIAILFINSAQTSINQAGVGAALVFISMPLFEIFFVSTMRLLQKRNPLKGSPDHFPLRLLKLVKKPYIAILIIYGWCMMILAGGIVILHAPTAFKVISAVIIAILFWGTWIRLARVKIDR